MSPLFDPEIESKLCTLLLFITFIFALFIIFIAFVTVRIDTIVEWSWAIVWIPAWILNVILLCSGTLFVFRDDKKDSEEKQKPRHGQLLKRVVWVLNMILVVLFQIFIIVRLDGVVLWSASIVFIPYFIFEGVQFLTDGTYAVLGCLALKEEKRKIPYFLVNAMWWCIVRFCLMLLIVLRIDRVIICSWGVVFIPLYLVGFKWALELGYKYHFYSTMTQPEMAHQGKVTVMIYTLMFVVLGLLFYTLVGLIARRLDGLVYINMSNVFVPLFLVFVSVKRLWSA